MQNKPKPAPVSFNCPGKSAGRRLSRGERGEPCSEDRDISKTIAFLRTLSPALSWKIKPLLPSIAELRLWLSPLNHSLHVGSVCPSLM